MPPSRLLNIPPGTRTLFLAVIVLSSLNAAFRFRKWSASLGPSTPIAVINASNYLSSPQWGVPFLVLIPVKSLIYPWTLVTAGLVENNVLSLGISAAVIFFGGRYLERAWGSTEFAKFVLFVTVIPFSLTFALYVLWHILTPAPDFATPIQGLIALEAGFLVALKQLVPEHTVSLFKGSVSIRIKHFPALFAFANILSGPLLGTDTALWLSLFGFLTSWIYLRFYRLSDITSAATGGQGTKMKGDASDTFAFVAFFPESTHPVLSPVCDGIFALLVQLRICMPFTAEAIEAGNESAASRSNRLPGGSGGRGASGRRAEAERRRALALRALDERLSAAAAASRPSNSPRPDAAHGDTAEEMPGVEVVESATALELMPTSDETPAASVKGNIGKA